MCATCQIDTCSVVQNQYKNISDVMRVDFDGDDDSSTSDWNVGFEIDRVQS